VKEKGGVKKAKEKESRPCKGDNHWGVSK